MLDNTDNDETPEDTSGNGAAEIDSSGPGVLRGDVSLTLHTQFALNTFNGRRATDDGLRSVPGLYRFASYLDQIAVGVAADDPYADAALVSIEGLMGDAEKTLADRITSFQGRLKSNTRMSIEMASSIAPHIVTLKLRSPYAHWAARLIGQFDELATIALSAHHVGMIDRFAFKKAIHEGSKLIRRPFHAAGQYRFSGLSRVDFEQQTGRVKEVVAERGEVAADILDRTVSPRFRTSPKSHE